MPLAGLAISPALVAAGALAYRRSTDPAVRAVAVGAVLAGAMALLLVALLLFAPAGGAEVPLFTFGSWDSFD